MPLPDVSFTNSLGTVSFKRCLLSVVDQWEWVGGSAKRRKSISISGHMKQTTEMTSEGWEGILTGISTGITTSGAKGNRGTLVLPWTTLTNIKVDNINVPVGQWIDYVPVTATFSDDNPNGNTYTSTFFGLEFHNPKISLPIPGRRSTDHFAQHPTNASDLTNDIRVAPMRFRSGYEMFDVRIQGTLMLPDVVLPAGLAEKLQFRKGTAASFTIPSTVPTGYPMPFNLVDAMPDFAGDNNLSDLIVVQSQIDWSVEEQMARIQINTIAQPQKYVEA